MTVIVKHPFVSAVPDGVDATVVRPSNWNADHTLSGLGTAAELDAGVAGGVATLDGSGKVPVSELPAAVIGGVSYQGTWNASTNTPTLTSSVGTKGFYYVVAVAGSTNLDGITDWIIGDWAIFNGSVWEKVDNTDAVTSVNGFTGAVVLTASDVGAQPAGTYVTSVGATAPVASSGGITPTISMASASAVVDGYLTNTDWSTFNAKQAALISGTNIKTVNSTTLLGSGDVSVGVTSVSGTAPVVSSGGATPAISMAAATTSVDGYLTSTDWNTFNNKGSGTVTSVSGTAGRITSTGGATPAIDLASGVASAGTTGSSSLIPVVTIDTYGRVTSITTAANPQGTVTSVTGTSPVVSSGGATPAISMPAATSSVNGYLTSADWTTFNSKGSVTSVAASVPSLLSISGSPITSSGTLAITYSGTALPVANGGTGLTAVGTTGNVLTSNGSAWVSSAPVSSNITAQGLFENAAIISANYTIGTGNNAVSAGPITINSGVVVTVPSGSVWVVV